MLKSPAMESCGTWSAANGGGSGCHPVAIPSIAAH